jgi:hypothetical protein
MAYLIGRFMQLYDTLCKEISERGKTEWMGLVTNIKELLDKAFELAQEDTNSLLRSMSCNIDDQHSPSNRPTASGQSSAPLALIEATSQRTTEVIWRAADRQGVDTVDMTSCKTFEHTKKDLMSGMYTLKFGFVPQSSASSKILTKIQLVSQI